MTVEVHLNAYGTLKKVGILRRHSGAGRERVTYEHDAAWLAASEAFEFDRTLPLQSGPLHPGANREMFGTLGDSAPDSWGRQLMIKRENRLAEQEGRARRGLQESDYLLGVSDHTRLGALRFSVDGVFQAPQTQGVPTTVALGDLLEAAQRIERGEETNEDLLMIFAPGSSLGGARPKASVYDQQGNLLIAKFPKPSDTFSVTRWEAIVLDMACAAGMSVSTHDLTAAAGRTVFLSRRFDRISRNGREEDQRIPFMSAMAMTQHNDGDDNCSYLELVDAINASGASPERDRPELFRRIAFTVLVSNTDDHFRNHGFLWAKNGGWTLSPAYDINPVPNGPRILRSRIDFDEAIASLELLRSVHEFFVPRDTAEEIIDECAQVVRRWRDFARARHAPDAEIEFMSSAFETDDLQSVT